MEAGRLVVRGNLLAIFVVVACCFWFFISLNPFDFGLPVGLYNHKRLMQVGLICLVSLLFFLRDYRSVLSDLCRERILLLLWGLSLFFVALSSAFADNPLHSAFESLHWLLLLSVFCCGFFIARTGYSNLLLLVLLALYTLVILKAVIFLVLELSVGGSLRANMLFPGVENHRFFNQVQVFMVPLLYIWAVRTELRKFAYFFLFLNLLLAFCGGARGLLLGLFAAGALAYLLLAPWRREIRVGALIALLAFAVYLAIGSAVDIAGASADVFRGRTAGRFAIWLGLIDALDFSHILIGEGTGAYSYHYFGFIVGHPHNSLLQFLYEWGVIGTLVAVAAVVWILVKARDVIHIGVCRGLDCSVNAALLVAVCSAGIYSLFSGIVVMPIPQTLLFLFAGLLLGLGAKGQQVDESVPRILPSRPLLYKRSGGFVAGLALFGLLFLYLRLCGGYLVQQAETPEELRGPRFWVEGAQFKEGG